MKADTIRTDERDASEAGVDEVRAAYAAFGFTPPLNCEEAYPSIGRATHRPSKLRSIELAERFVSGIARLGDSEQGGDLLYHWAVLLHYELQPLWHEMDRYQTNAAVTQSVRTIGARARALHEEGAW